MNKLYLIAVTIAMASAVAFQDTGVPIFRSTTRLVQVSTVATDKNGKPVTDLTKDDFELFEDGRKQDLAVFVAEQAKPVVRPVLAPGEFSNQFTTANASRSGYTLILLDWLNSKGLGARVASQQAVLRLLKQVEERDLVSLCVLDRELRVLHDFTGDRAELVRKIGAAYLAVRNATKEDRTDSWDSDALSLVPTPMVQSGINQLIATQRIANTFEAFEQIAGYLGSVQGRKSLIWVTSGFPSTLGYEANFNRQTAVAGTAGTDRRTFSPEIDRLMRRLNAADIAVYPVDNRGVLGGTGRGLVNLTTMKEIASRTGGRAYHSSNDIDTLVRNALDDSQTSYTLAYYPTNGDNDGRYRNIRVKVRRPGVTLRFRSGYEAEGGRKPATTVKAELQQALGSPLDITVLPLSVHAEKTGAGLAVQLRIEPSTLMLRQDKGRRTGKVSVFFAFRPPDVSGDLRVESESRDLDVPEAMYPKLLQQGLTFRKQIPIPAKATSLRMVVRDEESALMGSVTIPLAAVR